MKLEHGAYLPTVIIGVQYNTPGSCDTYYLNHHWTLPAVKHRKVATRVAVWNARMNTLVLSDRTEIRRAGEGRRSYLTIHDV